MLAFALFLPFPVFFASMISEIMEGSTLEPNLLLRCLYFFLSASIISEITEGSTLEPCLAVLRSCMSDVISEIRLWSTFVPNWLASTGAPIWLTSTGDPISVTSSRVSDRGWLPCGGRCSCFFVASSLLSSFCTGELALILSLLIFLAVSVICWAVLSSILGTSLAFKLVALVSSTLILFKSLVSGLSAPVTSVTVFCGDPGLFAFVSFVWAEFRAPLIVGTSYRSPL